jgi:hypothetical protein
VATKDVPGEEEQTMMLPVPTTNEALIILATLHVLSRPPGMSIVIDPILERLLPNDAPVGLVPVATIGVDIVTVRAVVISKIKIRTWILLGDLNSEKFAITLVIKAVLWAETCQGMTSDQAQRNARGKKCLPILDMAIQSEVLHPRVTEMVDLVPWSVG